MNGKSTAYIYRVIHEVLPPLREDIPEVIWDKNVNILMVVNS
jgi:hypothetical protein